MAEYDKDALQLLYRITRRYSDWLTYMILTMLCRDMVLSGVYLIASSSFIAFTALYLTHTEISIGILSIAGLCIVVAFIMVFTISTCMVMIQSTRAEIQRLAEVLGVEIGGFLGFYIDVPIAIGFALGIVFIINLVELAPLMAMLAYYLLPYISALYVKAKSKVEMGKVIDQIKRVYLELSISTIIAIAIVQLLRYLLHLDVFQTLFASTLASLILLGHSHTRFRVLSKDVLAKILGGSEE